MKFKEFRRCIEKYQDLSKELIKSKNEEESKIIKNKIIEIKKEMGDSFDKIWSIFRFDTELFLNRTLKDFFESKKIFYCYYEHDGRYWIAFNGNEMHALAPLDDNISLKCLYENLYSKGWDDLFVKFPDLKEYLWKFVEDSYNSVKKNRLSVIQKMLEEKSAELNMLENPEKVEQRKNQLRKEKYNLKYEKMQLEETIDEI